MKKSALVISWELTSSTFASSLSTFKPASMGKEIDVTSISLANPFDSLSLSLALNNWKGFWNKPPRLEANDLTQKNNNVCNIEVTRQDVDDLFVVVLNYILCKWVFGWDS
eukprot:GILI01045968.1.p2 GENE.GILI01045968.1~~GILI01045968.1.p2  ORF type:complete len:110 (-),score=1.16 GILI01045968.1:128-457(-)